MRRRAERDAGLSRAERDPELSRAERDPEPSRAERDPEPSCHECMEWPLLSCVTCHDLVEAIKEFHELKICRLRVMRLHLRAERDAGTSRAERDPEPSCYRCMEWPFLSCVACHDLVVATKELLRICRYAEPSFDELKEWLRLILNCWKL